MGGAVLRELIASQDYDSFLELVLEASDDFYAEEEDDDDEDEVEEEEDGG